MSDTVGLRHVQHCNVNCRDLDRSLAFYRDRLGLQALTRTVPEPQDGSGFGIDGTAQWDAWMMTGERVAPMIDLLEWKQPLPEGEAHPVDALGMVELHLTSPAVDRATRVTDPDGVGLVLEPGPELALRGVTLNVSDLTTSSAWYKRVLGLEKSDHGLRIPGDDFEIRLAQTASELAPYAAANHVGIYRIAFLVDDAADAVAEIRQRGGVCPDPVWLDMGPTIPIDGLWAAFFEDPDGTCLELIASPQSTAD